MTKCKRRSDAKTRHSNGAQMTFKRQQQTIQYNFVQHRTTSPLPHHLRKCCYQYLRKKHAQSLHRNVPLCTEPLSNNHNTWRVTQLKGCPTNDTIRDNQMPNFRGKRRKNECHHEYHRPGSGRTSTTIARDNLRTKCSMTDKIKPTHNFEKRNETLPRKKNHE